MISEIHFDELVAAGLINEEDFDLFITTLLFRDAIEIKFGKDEKKIARYKNQFTAQIDELFNDMGLGWRQRLLIIIDVLTPRLTAKDYQQRKSEDFQRAVDLWEKGEKIPLLVKVCDTFANLYETINDLERGLEMDE